jgi:Predicted O-methyltransferase
MTNSNLEQYILSHIDEQPPVLKELERHTNLNVLYSRMLSGHHQGTVLKMICSMIRPLSILEIGTFTGYSTICMALGMPVEGHIHTIEKNDEMESIILEYLEKANVINQVTLHIGNALDVINDIDEMFDFVFIDGDKREYPAYLEAVLPKLKKGGFILADNILWSGKVANPEITDNQTKGIVDFNDMIKNDSRFEKTILPLRDGLFIVQLKADNRQ